MEVRRRCEKQWNWREGVINQGTLVASGGHGKRKEMNSSLERGERTTLNALIMNLRSPPSWKNNFEVSYILKVVIYLQSSPKMRNLSGGWVILNCSAHSWKIGMGSITLEDGHGDKEMLVKEVCLIPAEQRDWKATLLLCDSGIWLRTRTEFWWADLNKVYNPIGSQQVCDKCWLFIFMTSATTLSADGY